MTNRPTSSRGNRPASFGTVRLTSPRQPVGPRAPIRGNPPPVPSSASRFDLRRAVSVWLADGKAQGWSSRTIVDRRQTMERFCWWLEHEARIPAAMDALDPARIRAFLIYVRELRAEGRYGSRHPSAHREVRPATVHAYFRILRAFSNFCLAEGLLEDTPLKNVKPPRVPTDQVQPFSQEQVQALLDAARRTRTPERDAAIVFGLVDTGMRVSELCGLCVEDVDRGTGEITVVGKGTKKRRLYLGPSSRRALWRYLETDRRGALADEPLFIAAGGHRSGAALTPNGVNQLIRRLGEAASIGGVRCSPHAFRHTFAIDFLRGGGNLFALQQLMGHASLCVLRRYIALAEADLAQAHREASPAEPMKLK